MLVSLEKIFWNFCFSINLKKEKKKEFYSGLKDTIFYNAKFVPEGKSAFQIPLLPIVRVQVAVLRP